jgi:hypothetical protein
MTLCGANVCFLFGHRQPHRCGDSGLVARLSGDLGLVEGTVCGDHFGSQVGILLSTDQAMHPD